MIVGIDAALAATGYTTATGTCHAIRPQRASATKRARRADIRMQLAPRLRLDRVRHHAAVAVIEGYLEGSNTIRATISRAELHGVIEEILYLETITPVFVNPSTLKSWAALILGRRPASKDDMVSAALTLGYDPHGDDNQADSALLHALGRQWYATEADKPVYGWPLLADLTPNVRKTLAKLAWPTLYELEEAAAR